MNKKEKEKCKSMTNCGSVFDILKMVAARMKEGRIILRFFGDYHFTLCHLLLAKELPFSYHNSCCHTQFRILDFINISNLNVVADFLETSNR